MINDIELKHSKLINKAKQHMSKITDFEHDINHMNDVVAYTYELLEKTKIDLNNEVCIICAYWHDVGRSKCIDGHEKVSAEMLKKEMTEQGYEEVFIERCTIAIENHKWNMLPKSNEGLIIKDADKLAWIGQGRWKSCLGNNQKLDSIIHLLPKLKSEILHFKESKEIYDRDIIKLIETIYHYKNNNTLDTPIN